MTVKLGLMVLSRLSSWFSVSVLLLTLMLVLVKLLGARCLATSRVSVGSGRCSCVLGVVRLTIRARDIILPSKASWRSLVWLANLMLTMTCRLYVCGLLIWTVTVLNYRLGASRVKRLGVVGEVGALNFLRSSLRVVDRQVYCYALPLELQLSRLNALVSSMWVLVRLGLVNTIRSSILVIYWKLFLVNDVVVPLMMVLVLFTQLRQCPFVVVGGRGYRPVGRLLH